MKTMDALVLLCVSLMGCTMLPHPDAEMVKTIERENERVEKMSRTNADPKVENNEACPRLPEIPEGASKEDGRLFTFTIIALYEQCAKSKR